MSDAARGCDALAPLVPWLANGTLGAEEAAALTVHLAACQACADLAAHAGAIRDRVRGGVPRRLLDHVDAQLLVEFVETPAALEEETRSWVGRHLESCAACGEATGILRDLGALPAAAFGPAPLAGRPVAARVRRSRYSPQALAIAAVVLFAGALFILKAPADLFFRPPGDTARSGGEIPIRALTPEDRPLPRTDCLLAWTAGPEGTVYEVTVATADLKVVARGRGLKEARFQVPEAALRDLPGGQLVWKVEAQLPGGGRVASPAFFARVG